MTLRITNLKARYIHGVGKNTRQFHLINLDRVGQWRTPSGEWTVLTIYTACGQREGMTSEKPPGRIGRGMTLAVDPPKNLKPCPRCFARWEKLGKPLTAEQWRDNAKALRVMTSHATRVKKEKR